MKKVICFLFLLVVVARGSDLPAPRTVPNLSRLKALRTTREYIGKPEADPGPMALADMNAGEEGHVLVLLVEFAGTNTFEWTPGVSTWDPLGHVDGDEWDGTNYNNAVASQFFADYHGIDSATYFTYSGPLHNEIPRPLSGDPKDRQWNRIWYPDFSPDYYEKIAFSNGVVFDFHRGDGSHYYADHTGISVKKYYTEMSSGAFALTGDVYGWVSVPHSVMYYGADDVPGRLSVGASVYAEVGGSAAVPGAGSAKSLVVDACRAAVVQYPEINWADYDLDDDGEIDSLWIITAGFGEADGALYDDSLYPESRMWPHSSSVYPLEEIADGVSVGAYIMNPENSGVYVLGHEYGHALGAIDLYAYQEGTLSPGNWAIMYGSQSGFPEGFKPVAMDPYHLDGWDWLNPYSVDHPATSATVELYQSGTGLHVPAGMHRAARIRLEDQTIDLPVDPPAGKLSCWWGGNRSYDMKEMNSFNTIPYIEGASSSLSFKTAYEMEDGEDFIVVFISYYDFGTETWSDWELLANARTVDEYDGVYFLPEPFAGLTGTSPSYPAYHTETFSLSAYAGKYIAYSIAHVTDEETQLAGPFIGEVTLDPDDGYAPYEWSADDPEDMVSEWLSVDGDYDIPHYYYLQWRNTATNGGYDDVLGFVGNRFGRSTSGLLTWYVNEFYSDNEAPDYLDDFPSYGAKGVALVVDAHPETFFKSEDVWGHPCTNPLAAYHNLYLNADATFGFRPTALFPDGENGELMGRSFFTDSRNYCAGAEHIYLNPTSVPPTFEWVARKFDGSVAIPSKAAYGCRAQGMPNDAEIHRVWIDRDGELESEFETAKKAGGFGNPLDVSGEYGWNFQVLEDNGTSGVVKIWNSHHNAPYPVLLECVGNGSTLPSDDFLASPATNSVVQVNADEYYYIDQLLYNGTEISAAAGKSTYTLQGKVSKNTTVYAIFAPDMVEGSQIPKQWFAEQDIPLVAGVLTQDFDGDGLSNEDEYAAGTRANDASSCLRLTASKSEEDIELVWESQWNHWYALELSTNLITDPFQKVSGWIPGEYNITRRSVVVPNGNAAFYRIRLDDPAP